MPITWRNVNSRGTGEAARLLEGAGRSINAGLGQFRNSLNRAQDTREENYDVRGENNTQAFRDKLASYRSPEELAAARESGEIAQFAQSLGQNVDKEILNNAPTTRLNALRDQANTEYQYDETQLTREQRPVVEAMNAAIVNGDGEAFDQLLSDNPDLRNQADFLRRREAAERTQLEQDRADDEYQYRINERNERDADEQRVENLDAQTGREAQAIRDAERSLNNVIRESGGDRETLEALSASAPSQSEMVQDTLSRMSQENDMTFAERQAAEERLMGLINNEGRLTSRDTRQLDDQLEVDRRKYKPDTNPYNYNSDYNRSTTAVDLFDEMSSSGNDDVRDALNANREGFTKEYNDMISSGVEITVDGKKETVPVTPEIIRAASRSMVDGWFVNKGLEDVTREYLTSGGGMQTLNEWNAWENAELRNQAARNDLAGREASPQQNLAKALRGSNDSGTGETDSTGSSDRSASRRRELPRQLRGPTVSDQRMASERTAQQEGSLRAQQDAAMGNENNLTDMFGRYSREAAESRQRAEDQRKPRSWVMMP